MEHNKPEGKKPARSIHTGHRQRVKNRLLEYGGEQLEDYQLLELILFYSHPQGDVNPLAHRLIDKFGSLRGVLDAPASEVKEIVGISDHTAALFRLFVEVMIRYQQSTTAPGTIISSTEDAGEVLRSYFVGAREEIIYLLSVDAKGKLISCDRIARGAADAVLLDQRRVVETAIRRRASQVFLAHCHISGLATPSREDRLTTCLLCQALEPLGIRLTDHLVFADGDYVSMAQSGMLEELY